MSTFSAITSLYSPVTTTSTHCFLSLYVCGVHFILGLLGKKRSGLFPTRASGLLSKFIIVVVIAELLACSLSTALVHSFDQLGFSSNYILKSRHWRGWDARALSLLLLEKPNQIILFLFFKVVGVF